LSNIAEVHHVSLIVADTERSLTFYRDLLGLAVVERAQLSFPGAWLAVGERQIHLLELPNTDPVEKRPQQGGRDRHLALRVRSLDLLVERLEEAGIELTHSSSGRRAIFCRDPDGNALEFVEV
jgi:glyoxylase I family protein